MRKYIQLDIPVPCHEDWDQMTAVEQGRFCKACQKNVVDFSNMSDTELLNYFVEKKNVDTCGHYRADQLSRKIMAPQKTVPWFKYLAASLFPALLLTIKAKAQGIVSQPQIEIVPSKIKAVTSDPGMPLSSAIKGQVLDEQGNGIPNASVELLPGNTGTLTDSSGAFSIDIVEGKLRDLQIKISSVGYSIQRMDLSTLKGCNYKIVLIRDAQLMGEVVIVSPGRSIKCGRMVGMTIVSGVGFVDTLKSMVWPLKVKASIFPNPLRKEEMLYVRASLADGKEYRLAIADAGGRILFNQLIRGTHTSTLHPLTLPSNLVTGTYFITVKDKKSKIIVSDKVIVL